MNLECTFSGIKESRKRVLHVGNRKILAEKLRNKIETSRYSKSRPHDLTLRRNKVSRTQIASSFQGSTRRNLTTET